MSSPLQGMKAQPMQSLFVGEVLPVIVYNIPTFEAKVCAKLQSEQMSSIWGKISGLTLISVTRPPRKFTPDHLCQISKKNERITVRLLIHVLCKPTHFFFHSFIATLSYSLQTSFISAMKDWADKYHVWGTPRGHLQGQTHDNSNTRIFHTKKEHIYMCSYIIPVVYIYGLSVLTTFQKGWTNCVPLLGYCHKYITFVKGMKCPTWILSTALNLEQKSPCLLKGYRIWRL